MSLTSQQKQFVDEILNVKKMKVSMYRIEYNLHVINNLINKRLFNTNFKRFY